MKIGLISGYRIENFYNNSEKLTIETSYGEVPIEITERNNNKIFFINRHGADGKIPSHMINYRANIEAFSSCHVNHILSISTVGSMKKKIQKGDIVLPHDFIDLTKSRPLTFYDESRVHVDFTNPFCPYLRKSLEKYCSVEDIDFHKMGVYLTTEGPRLETVSEINLFSKFADIVGMTLVPEITLAHEKGICFATICLVCNMAAGLQNNLQAKEIFNYFKEKESRIANIIGSTIDSIENKYKCHCKEYISRAIL